MRPTPAEVISGIRSLLRDVIEPEVHSDFALERLREVRNALAQVDWNDASHTLACRCDVMRRMLVDVWTWVHLDEVRNRAFVPILNLLEDALDGPDREHKEVLSEPFTVLQNRVVRYSQLLVELVEPLETWISAHPDDPSAPALRNRIVAGLLE